MTSRVTVMPKLESSDDSPAKGRRHGTRARAAAKWAARSDTSNAAIGLGAVCTSGRFPIAMCVRFPRSGHNVNTASTIGRWWGLGRRGHYRGERSPKEMGEAMVGLATELDPAAETGSPTERTVAAAAPPDRLQPGTTAVILLV